MNRFSSLIAFVLFLALFAASVTAEERPKLDYSKVGVYGACFDFCDYSVLKIQVKDDAYYRKMAERINQVHAEGKLNVVGLYCFDHVTHSRPIEEYIANANQMLNAIDLKKVHAVFLSEENVTWNKGLEILNGICDHIKAKYNIPVYQWYSMPMLAHPKQRADGWIIDPYGMKGEAFRRYLMKYVVMGKPVINCAFASPEGKFSGQADERLAATRDQIVTCKEFNAPMFFYCVDPKLGSPSVWLKSDDPEIVKVRDWLLGEIKQMHATDASKLPLPSADRSIAQAVPVAGNLDNVYVYEERFDDIRQGFIDDASIDGFPLLRWDSEKEALYVTRTGARRNDAQLLYHFTSEFEMSQRKAVLEGEVKGDGSQVTIALSADGQQFGHESLAQKEGKFTLTSDAAGDQNFVGKKFWVRIKATVGDQPEASIALDRLRVTCHVAPPDRREIVLAPDAAGHISYVDDFQTQKHLHLSKISSLDHLEWERGHIGTHGVKGTQNVVTLKQKFVSEKPISRLRVRMTSTAHRALGSLNTLGLSLDGQQPLLSETSQGKEKENGAYRDALEIDASKDGRFANIKEFWVHLAMTNTSCIAGRTSNKIMEYRIEAEASN